METTGSDNRLELLLIEDSSSDALILRRLLDRSETPCSLQIESSLELGLACAGRSTPDLILLDLFLPDSHGLATFVAAVERFPACPIVVISGLEDEEVAKAAVAKGAQDYLVKGQINAAALRRAIVYSVERNRFEQEQAELQRQRAQGRKLEAIGQLAAGVAHELNTPIQYVGDNTRFLESSFLELVEALVAIRDLTLEPSSLTGEAVRAVLERADVEYLIEQVPKALDESLDGLDRVTRLVRAMKDFSHPSNGEMSAVDLNRALDSAIVVSANEWKYLAEVVRDFDPELPVVTCRVGEMSQVFLNLIVNAAHAIADLPPTEGTKGRITIASRRCSSDAVEIAISDTGCGIRSEHIDRVFDPFFTTKAVGRGTGQGLAISYALVTKHQGRIEVDSRVGSGTTFRIHLPVLPSQTSVPSQTGAASQTGTPSEAATPSQTQATDAA